MWTGKTALSALIIFLAAGEASGNAIQALTSRPQRYPEIPFALTLIPPLFQRADNDSAAYPPRLFVLGKADWLDEFLRLFPSVATIYVFTGEAENIAKFQDSLVAEMMPSASIALRFFPYVGNYVASSVSVRVRFITWISFDSDYDADDFMLRFGPSFFDSGHIFFRLMVTARPRGTTHVFSVPMPSNPYNRVPARGKLLGVWPLSAAWSTHQVSLFPRLCASWRPPPDGQPLLAQIFEFSVNGLDGGRTISAEYYKRTEEYKVLRLLRDSYGLVFQTEAKIYTEAMKPLGAADSCRLDVVAFPNEPFTGLIAQKHSELSFFPWEFDCFILVVPTGAGKQRPVWYPLTAEYTPAVWTALAAAVLAVVACLHLTRRDESVQELVLQALSPLLGQPFNGRRTWPQIAVLGGWLLVCVVVVGGYQGQLLGFITVPPQNRDINSWQDWLESDLVILDTKKFSVATTSDSFGFHGLTEDRVLRLNTDNAIKFVATHRNASLLTTKKHMEKSIKEIFDQYEIKEVLSKVHIFALNNSPQFPGSEFLTLKKSPFEVPLRKILGRIRAAGGLSYDRIIPSQATADSEDKPISLLNLLPVYAAYIVGNIFAVFTFLLEFFLQTLRKFRCNNTPRKP